MKKIAKLNDVAFHLINKVNKKKLKINTLLIKNWKKILERITAKLKSKKLLCWKDSLLNFEFSMIPVYPLNYIHRWKLLN